MADSSQKKTRRNAITHKAWSLVRMALLWGRKGGVFKRWPLFELRSLFSKHLKALAHMRHHSSSNGDRYYGERQLSFDETPLFNVKKHCPTTSSMRFLLLPCIAPPVDFDYDFEMDGQDYSNEVKLYGYDELKYESCTEEDDEEEEKGVDVRAEEFIAKFYEQIKLQRQVSYLEYKQHKDAV
ncbi:PREDICTED: uncharacterized protein LOC104713786 [Camelina sativa]|uniref:Uncharacterized protein LOC104713786 n=1 Tax=Camelina sativa TaxID=90675 RepID=A0ABM0TPE7_CAMSA|nr:PREDICTED: uncharacterized protein LOC104713786 [Camelina sativa]